MPFIISFITCRTFSFVRQIFLLQKWAYQPNIAMLWTRLSTCPINWPVKMHRPKAIVGRQTRRKDNKLQTSQLFITHRTGFHHKTDSIYVHHGQVVVSTSMWKLSLLQLFTSLERVLFHVWGVWRSNQKVSCYPFLHFLTAPVLGNPYQPHSMPRTPSADNTRANALLAFSKSFKKIKRAKTMAAQRKRRRKRKKKLKRSQSMPSMRTNVPQELLWAFINDINLSQPLSYQINSWENFCDSINTSSNYLNVNGENPDRKRSASLIPYTDKQKKKAPRPDQLQLEEREKVALIDVYKRGKKVWIAGFLLKNQIKKCKI